METWLVYGFDLRKLKGGDSNAQGMRGLSGFQLKIKTRRVNAMDKKKLRGNLRIFEKVLVAIVFVSVFLWIFGLKKPTDIIVLVLVPVLIVFQVIQTIMTEVQASKAKKHQNGTEASDIMGKKKLGRILGILELVFLILMYADLFLRIAEAGKMPFYPVPFWGAAVLAKSLVDWRIEEAEEAQKK